MSKNFLLAILSISVLVFVSIFFWFHVAPANKQQLLPPALAPVNTVLADEPQKLIKPAPFFDGSWESTSTSFIGYRLTQLSPSEDQEIVGRTNKVESIIAIQDNKVQNAQTTAMVRSLSTSNKEIDGIFSDDMMQADSFPSLQLLVTSLEIPESKKRIENVAASGTLTLKDKTQDIAFTIDMQLDSKGNIELIAIIDIFLPDYGIAQPLDSLTSYSDTAQIEAHLFYEKSS